MERLATVLKVLGTLLRAFAKIWIVWVAYSVVTGTHGLTSIGAVIPAVGWHAKAALSGVLLVRYSNRISEEPGTARPSPS